MQGAAAPRLEQQEWQEPGWAVTGLPACCAAAHLAALQWAWGQPSQPSTGASPTRPSPLALQQHSSALQTGTLQTGTKISLLIVQLSLLLCWDHSCARVLCPEDLEQEPQPERDERNVQEGSRALAIS